MFRPILLSIPLVSLAACEDEEASSGVSTQEIQELRAALTALEATVATLQGELDDATTTIAALEQDVAGAVAVAEATQERLDDATTTIAALDLDVAEATALAASVQEQLDGTTAAVQGLAEEDLFLYAHIDDLNTAIEDAVPAAAVGNLLALEPYLSVQPATHEVQLVGANLLILNGAGATASANGLGNLIVGYHEAPSGRERTGSHNVVIGPDHGYTAWSSLISGAGSLSAAPNTLAIGGQGHAATGLDASCVGGISGTASGWGSAVFGAHGSQATAFMSRALGGYNSVVSADYAVGVGGVYQSVTGYGAAAVGGNSLVSDATYGIALP